MKVKVGREVWIQKYEMAYIMREISDVPASLLEELFAGGSVFTMTGFDDSLKFACVFRKAKNVKWLMEQDWIVDYNAYKNVPYAALKSTRKKLIRSYRAETEAFDSREENFRRKNRSEQEQRFSKMMHKEYSFELMLKYFKKKINFVVPTERTLVGYKNA
ncbi:hypothetical protein IKT18_02990 [Candidatus Saccharibacteria bacterium]|nr:hypothetical protein [Candidatus Saccharibacteria bacterium]